MSDLARLVDPKTIAIAGISADPAKHGARVLANLRKLGFEGRIWGVNPGLPEIDGVEVVRGVRDLPAPPDLVVAAVPAPAVTGLVAECEGVGGVIVFAAGFGESGDRGRALETELAEVANGVGTRVLGPNSGGIIRPDRGLAASFLTCLDRPAEQIVTGPVGVVSQSGGTGSYLHNLAAARGEGLAISVSTGNEADLALGEVLAAVGAIDGVEAIVAIVETIRDGAGFIAAIRALHEHGRQVVVCPLGTESRSERLMASHTGALALPAVVTRGVFESLGMGIAETPAEAYEVASVVARSRRPRGARVGVVTHSGGVAILLSDLAARDGLALPHPSPALSDAVASSLDHGSATNPLDLGGIIGGPTRFAEVVGRFAGSGEYDAVLAVSTAHPPAHTAERVAALIGLDPPVPVVHLWMAGDQGAAGLAKLRQAGAAVVEEPRAAIRAMTTLTRPPSSGEPPPPLTGPPDSWGIPPLAGVVAESADAAVAAAAELGYPVTVKLESPAVSHKTEVGGVALDLRDPEAVAEAFVGLTSLSPAIGLEGATVRVQGHRPGVELIVGSLRHHSFGPMVSVGVGGVLTELIGDVVFAPAPVTVGQGRAMVDRLRGRAILDGFRGSPPADLDRLAEILSLVSRGIAGSGLTSFEINPLIWDGEDWLAVDWLAL